MYAYGLIENFEKKIYLGLSRLNIWQEPKLQIICTFLCRFTYIFSMAVPMISFHVNLMIFPHTIFYCFFFGAILFFTLNHQIHSYENGCIRAYTALYEWAFLLSIVIVYAKLYSTQFITAVFNSQLNKKITQRSI